MKTTFIIFCISLACLFLTSCGDEEELRDLFNKELAQVKAANEAHLKIISDKDAQLYKAEILNARTQGLISIKLANDALDTLKVQEKLFPKLKTEDVAKVNKDLAAIKASEVYEKVLLSEDTVDVMALNIVVPKDTATYNKVESNLTNTMTKADTIAIKDAKQTDADNSWFGFGRLIYGAEDSFWNIVIFGGSFIVILLAVSLGLSMYPPTAPIGALIGGGISVAFTVAKEAVYWLIICPVETIVQLIWNNIQTATTKT